MNHIYNINIINALELGIDTKHIIDNVLAANI